MTELSPQQLAFSEDFASELSGIDGDEVLEAKSHLAKALVLNGASIPDSAARAIEYLYWSLGPVRAGRIVKRQLALRIRQNTGFADYIVNAIKALATIENKEASLFGSMGKGGDK